jgi:AcrR family transcriptional regulator
MRKRSYETKGGIVAVAKRLFFDIGYSASSVDKIAGAAHIQKKTFYAYFPDKKSLFLEIINDTIGTPWVFIHPTEEMSKPEDLYRILVIIAKGLNETYSNPDYVRLLQLVISELSSQPELTSITHNVITRRAYDILVPLLVEADKKNIVSILNPKQHAQSFVGGLLYDFYVDGILSTYPGTVRRYSDLEIFEYVSTSMPLLVRRIVEKH